MTSRILVVPGHRVESQCVATVLDAGGLAATTDPDVRDIRAVVAVVPHDLPIADTLDAIGNSHGRLPLLLLTSQSSHDAAALGTLTERYGLAAVASLDCSTQALVTIARQVLEGWHQAPSGSTWSGGESVTLTAREQEVLALLAAGQRNQEIAEELGISRHTVRTHVQHLLAKLNVHHRHAAAAAQHGLMTEHDRRLAYPQQGLSR
jgi:DNA-binding NarL/FixJ family response regulator